MILFTITAKSNPKTSLNIYLLGDFLFVEVCHWIYFISLDIR